MELVSKKDLIRAGRLDKFNLQFTAGLIMDLLKLNQINDLYNRVSHKEGVAFVDAALEDLRISTSVPEHDLKNVPTEGPFITVSNHPFGLLDGLLLIHTLGKIRPDFKVMANFMLQRIETMSDLFIAVDPFDGKSISMNMSGIKASLRRLSEGHPVGLFPAGEVSTYQRGFTELADKPWLPSIIKTIRKANVPVVPLYFHGTNSAAFHLLGKIHPHLRTAKIPSELFKKRNQNIQIRIGRQIGLEELQAFSSHSDLGEFLRARVYALSSSLNRSKVSPRFRLSKPEPIVDAIPPDVMERELQNLDPACKIFSRNDSEVYMASSQDIPSTLQEIGRLRELTFRKIGEGTNRKTDLDEFDDYYDHLILWEKSERKILGGYRLGKGDQIFSRLGIPGFYTSSLFQYQPEFGNYLKESLELGRSFVVDGYQKRNFPLFLLWKGIEAFLRDHKQYKYLVGPVSISNYYSKLSRSFLITFIKKYYYNNELAKLVKARKVYEVGKWEQGLSVLINNKQGNLKELDKLIAEIEPERYTVPVLIKKYIAQNARIIGFNVDPKFNDCLDGLMILDLKELPDSGSYQI